MQSLRTTSCRPRVYDDGEREGCVSILDDGPGLAGMRRSACPMRVHEGALRVEVGVITESNLS